MVRQHCSLGEMEIDRPGGLVRNAAAGDHQAWNQLVNHFSGLLWSIAVAHRLNQSDAGDVVQTTWLKLLENLHRLRDPDRVGAWLATTARRESQRTLLLSGRELPTDDERQLETHAGKASTPESLLVVSERDRLLRRAFAKLPERCQRLLRILVMAAPSYEEVAAAMDMPIGSIGPTRARCLKRLRRILLSTGINAEVWDS
jgi:RNA polymerase sigma factor (sigma-70 family)